MCRAKRSTVVTTGRHDPCVGLRATPIAEAMMALVLMDHYLRHRAQCGDVIRGTPDIAAAARAASGARTNGARADNGTRDASIGTRADVGTRDASTDTRADAGTRDASIGTPWRTHRHPATGVRT